MPKLLNESVEKQIREVFAGLKEPVRLIFFSSEENCEYCTETQQLAGEVVALSDKLSLECHDIHAEAALASQYHVEHTPALVLAARDGDQVIDRGVRLLGIPAGHDFAAFIQDLLLVSNRDSGLTEATREFLRTINKPLHLQVFVTPT
jgi:alkyl hydroperoxide reductase subunit AhpF